MVQQVLFQLIQLSSINSTNNEFTFSAWLINYGSSNNYYTIFHQMRSFMLDCGRMVTFILRMVIVDLISNVVPPLELGIIAYLVRNGAAVYLDEYILANCNGYLLK